MAALGIGLLALWALDPITVAFGTRFNSVWYEVIGPLPAAGMLLALALGVAASAVWRRTIPAMAVTLVAYAAVRFPIHFFRMHVAPPRTSTLTLPLSTFLQKPDVDRQKILGPSLSADDWVFKTTAVGPSGHPIVNGFRELFQSYCPGFPSRGLIESGTVQACQTKIAGLNVRVVSLFQPAGRFWTLQAIEILALFALAAGLIAANILIIDRRRSV